MTFCVIFDIIREKLLEVEIERGKGLIGKNIC